ncbi:MAG: hypothetical protein RR290_03160 [Clostridia bacterium]
MAKKYAITFSITLLILVSLSLVMLMLMIPQKQESLTSSVQKYEQINKNDYKFEQTKDISKEALVREYVISDIDIATFKKYNQLKLGNSDPFTPSADLENESNNNNQGNTNNNNTNGNGGAPNPPSTNK